jgi:hypothetical protein
VNLKKRKQAQSQASTRITLPAGHEVEILGDAELDTAVGKDHDYCITWVIRRGGGSSGN